MQSVIDEQRLLGRFLQLVRIDSVSRCEKGVCDYCQELLVRLGCEVHIDDTRSHTGSNSGNLIAELKGTLPGKIYFSAHMDTVEPGCGIEPYVDEDSVIRSRGKTILGGDDKSGIAAILEMIEVLVETQMPHPSIGILFSVCEEINLRGASTMDAGGFSGEPCFVLDANGRPGTAIIGAPYHHKFTAHFYGKAAHAGVEPENGVSAITLAAKAISAMELGRLGEHTTANIGTIHGGSADNIVADSCVISGECRSLDLDELGRTRAQIHAALEGAVLGGGGKVEVDWQPQYAGYLYEHDDPLVQSVLAVARDIGLNAQSCYTGGGSDANVFAAKGLQPIVLATGMNNVHSLDEDLRVQDLCDIARLCVALASGSGP